MALLEAKKISKKFGGLIAIKDVSFKIESGQILGLIGPNGAGKTTIFNLLSGVNRPNGGEIFYRGKPISSLKAHQVCRLGISRTYQIVKPFNNMKVIDNVKVALFFGHKLRDGHRDETEEAESLLDFIGLSSKANSLAKSLTLVDRKRLEIARALATHPDLLLLDEVIAGLNPTEAHYTVDLIRQVRERKITIFMIEHVMRVIMELCDEIIVLDHGELVSQGTPQAISNDPAVIRAYLGNTNVGEALEKD